MLDMKSKAACFTGHRTLPEENLPEIAERLENALIALIEQDYCYFSAGGALGFDTLAAQTVLRLRERYPQIRLILCCRAAARQGAGLRQILTSTRRSSAVRTR